VRYNRARTGGPVDRSQRVTRTRFRDRREAGRILAKELNPYAGDDVIELALPRDGVPVGYEVAKALRAPLDVFIVRKLGVPGIRGAGAIAR
jgi:predicted phosphoribosyltransferase